MTVKAYVLMETNVGIACLPSNQSTEIRLCNGTVCHPHTSTCSRCLPAANLRIMYVC